MPEHIRALVAILLLTVPVLLLAKSPACAVAIPEADFRRRRNLWITLTLLAFLCGSFWVFMAVAAVLLLAAGRRDPNPMALFFFLVFAIPALSSEIPGLGLARQLFDLSYPRLLSLTILLPAALAILAEGQAPSPATRWSDGLLASYLFLNLTLQLSVDSFTNTLRYGLYDLMDVVLPYYVASRSIRSLREFRDVHMSFVVAAMVLAAIGTFEYVKKWLLYSSLDNALGLDWNYGSYLARGESLRALATAGQPIALGFVMAVACGLYLFLRPSVPDRSRWLQGLLLLCAGLLAPVSRGPWLGAALAFALFVATGPKPFENLSKLLLAGLIAGPLLLFSPLSDTLLEHIPLLGSGDPDDTVLYRQLLLKQSLDIIRQNPLFGSFDFLRYLEDLRQGQGIIDIVNTYLGVALSSGLVGLSLFAAFFLSLLQRLRRATLALPGQEKELHLLGRVLLTTLAGILIIIFTVSSITIIPVVYWSVAGLGLAYVRLLEKRPAPRTERLRVPPPRPAGLRA